MVKFKRPPRGSRRNPSPSPFPSIHSVTSNSPSVVDITSASPEPVDHHACSSFSAHHDVLDQEARKEQDSGPSTGDPQASGPLTSSDPSARDSLRTATGHPHPPSSPSARSAPPNPSLNNNRDCSSPPSDSSSLSPAPSPPRPSHLTLSQHKRLMDATLPFTSPSSSTDNPLRTSARVSSPSVKSQESAEYLAARMASSAARASSRAGGGSPSSIMIKIPRRASTPTPAATSARTTGGTPPSTSKRPPDSARSTTSMMSMQSAGSSVGAGMTDQEKVERVAQLIETYGEPQELMCSCCAEMFGRDEQMDDEDDRMDIDGDEADVKGKGKATAPATTAVLRGQAAIDAGNHPKCMYYGSVSGSSIPDSSDRKLFRTVTLRTKGRRGNACRCSNCLRNNTECLWVESAMEASRSLLNHGLGTSTRGTADDDDRMSVDGASVSGQDWYDDGDGGVIRRSRRTSTPVVLHDHRGLRAGSIASSAPGLARVRGDTPPAIRRMKNNVLGAIKNTMRHLQVDKLARERHHLLGGGKKGKGKESLAAVNKMKSGYKKAGRASTPQLEGEGESENGDEPVQVQGKTWIRPVKPKQVSTLLRTPTYGADATHAAPFRTEIFALPIPPGWAITQGREFTEAENIRREAFVTVKKKGNPANPRSRSATVTSQGGDDQSEAAASSQLHLTFRKCLGCTLRKCDCSPIQLDLSTAVEKFAAWPTQLEHFQDGCKRCLENGVICSFSLKPPIYGDWAHVNVEPRTSTEDMVVHFDGGIDADDEEEIDPVDEALVNPILQTSNKCTGCLLRKVPCRALPLGEGGLGGCERCRDCNVSCSFSIGHPVCAVEDWRTKPVEKATADGDVQMTPASAKKRAAVAAVDHSDSETDSDESSDLSEMSEPEYKAKRKIVTPKKVVPARAAKPVLLASPPKKRGRPSKLSKLMTTPQKAISKAATKPVASPTRASSRVIPPRPAPVEAPARPKAGRKSLGAPAPAPAANASTSNAGAARRITLPATLQAPAAPPRKPSAASLRAKHLPVEPIQQLVATPDKTRDKSGFITVPMPAAQPAPTPVTHLKKFFGAIRTVLEAVAKPLPAQDESSRGSPSSASPPRGDSNDTDTSASHEDMDSADTQLGGPSDESGRIGPHICKARNCGKQFSYIKGLQRHQKKSGCGAILARIALAHGPPPPGPKPLLQCPAPGCTRSFRYPSTLEQHRQSRGCPDANGSPAFTCSNSNCRLAFDSADSLGKHLLKGKCKKDIVPSKTPMERVIDEVMGRMDEVIVAVNLPTAKLNKEVAAKYNLLVDSMDKLKKEHAKSGQGRNTELEKVIHGFDMFTKGLAGTGMLKG